MIHQRLRRENPTAGPAGYRPSDVRADARDIARLAARLSPSHSDPERFYLHREEVVTRLRALADALGAGR